MNASLSVRDVAEVERSTQEARRIGFRPQELAQITRYLDPPASSPFPLEYAFHLLGDVRGKTVLDFGCGSGECVIPLIRRGANVIAVDISPELLDLAQKRLDSAGVRATLKVGSAYETGLRDGSVDVIFCMALIHHLDIGRVRDEMLRVLTRDGYIVLKEPVRFSQSYAAVRKMLPARNEISAFEHPLTQEELATMTEHLRVEGLQYFRLPIVPLALRWCPAASDAAWRISAWTIQNWPATKSYATSVVMRLRKQSSG